MFQTLTLPCTRGSPFWPGVIIAMESGQAVGLRSWSADEFARNVAKALVKSIGVPFWTTPPFWTLTCGSDTGFVGADSETYAVGAPLITTIWLAGSEAITALPPLTNT